MDQTTTSALAHSQGTQAPDGGQQHAEHQAGSISGKVVDSLADDLGKRFPEGTIIQFNYLPTVQALVAITRNEPIKAIEALKRAAPYELGGNFSLYPVFARGEAYLAAHQGTEAVVEFQKILDHRGVVCNLITGALAHLGLARAYTLSGDTAKARARAPSPAKARVSAASYCASRSFELTSADATRRRASAALPKWASRRAASTL